MSRRCWFALLLLLGIHPSLLAQDSGDPPAPDPAALYIKECLNQSISVDFQETPLRDAIECLRVTLRLPLLLDEVSLAEEDVWLDRPISMKLDDITGDSTLYLLLHSVHLGSHIVDGYMMITTEHAAKGEPVWRTYPVADLLITEADYVDQRCGDRLVELILRTVDPLSWNENHGRGEIEFRREEKALRIYQTLDGHDQVHQLLEAVRRAGGSDAMYRLPWTDQ